MRIPNKVKQLGVAAALISASVVVGAPAADAYGGCQSSSHIHGTTQHSPAYNYWSNNRYYEVWWKRSLSSQGVGPWTYYGTWECVTA